MNVSKQAGRFWRRHRATLVVVLLFAVYALQVGHHLVPESDHSSGPCVHVPVGGHDSLASVPAEDHHHHNHFSCAICSRLAAARDLAVRPQASEVFFAPGSWSLLSDLVDTPVFSAVHFLPPSRAPPA